MAASKEYEKVGSCPRCGAPVYMTPDWDRVSAPPSATYTCGCVSDNFGIPKLENRMPQSNNLIFEKGPDGTMVARQVSAPSKKGNPKNMLADGTVVPSAE